MSTINTELAAAAALNSQNNTLNRTSSTSAASKSAFASALADAMLYNATSSLGDFSESSAASANNGLFGSGSDLLTAGLTGSMGSSLLGTSSLFGTSSLLGNTSSLNNPYGLSTRNTLGSLMLGSSGDSSSMVMMLMMMLLLSQQSSQPNSLNGLLGNLLLGSSSSFCDSCLQGNSSATSEEATPVNAWEAANPVITNRAGSRRCGGIQTGDQSV